MDKLLRTLLVAIFTPLLILWLAKMARSQKPHVRAGVLIFPVSRGHRAFWGGSALAYIFMIFILARDFQGSFHLMGMLFFAFLAGVGLWMSLGEIRVNDQGIEKRFAWKSDFIRWEEVCALEQREDSSFFVYSRRQFFSFPASHAGCDQLVEEISKRGKVELSRPKPIL